MADLSTLPRSWAQDQRGRSQPGPSGWLPPTGHKVHRAVERFLGPPKEGRFLCLKSPLLCSEGGPWLGEDGAPRLLPRWCDGYHTVSFLTNSQHSFRGLGALCLAIVRDILGNIWCGSLELDEIKMEIIFWRKKSTWSFNWDFVKFID